MKLAKLIDNNEVINRPLRWLHGFIKSPDGISIELLQKGENLELKEPWQGMETLKLVRN